MQTGRSARRRDRMEALCFPPTRLTPHRILTTTGVQGPSARWNRSHTTVEAIPYFVSIRGVASNGRLGGGASKQRARARGCGEMLLSHPRSKIPHFHPPASRRPGCRSSAGRGSNTILSACTPSSLAPYRMKGGQGCLRKARIRAGGIYDRGPCGWFQNLALSMQCALQSVRSTAHTLRPDAAMYFGS